MPISVDTRIDVYPELSFLEYAAKQLGSRVFIVGVIEKYLVERIQRTGRFSQFIPKNKKIARVNQDKDIHCNIYIKVLNHSYITCIKDLADSYNLDYEERKRVLGEGYTKIVGDITWHISYSTTAQGRKKRLFS